jgi:hypothetical protein
VSDLYHFRLEGREYRIPSMDVLTGRRVQKATGRTLGKFDAGLSEGDVDCLAALVWVARLPQEPGLQFEAVNFDITTFEPIGDDESEATDAEGKAPADGETETPPQEG